MLLSLQGKVFDETNLNPVFLVGQKFSETVFWQSSEHTPKILERAIEESAIKGIKVQNHRLIFVLVRKEKLIVELSLLSAERKHEQMKSSFVRYDITEAGKTNRIPQTTRRPIAFCRRECGNRTLVLGFDG